VALFDYQCNTRTEGLPCFKKKVPSDCHQITSTTSPKRNKISSLQYISNCSIKTAFTSEKKTWGNVFVFAQIFCSSNTQRAGSQWQFRRRWSCCKQKAVEVWRNDLTFTIGASCNKLVVYKLWFEKIRQFGCKLAGILPQTQCKFDPLQLFVFCFFTSSN